ncbi:amino acid adenylation domain-containing protein [Streptomyces sp. NPDC055287]
MRPSPTGPPPSALARLLPPGRPPSAHCHALSVRLPDGADFGALERALAEGARLWWPELASCPPVLWREPVPAASTSAAADHRRHAETHRSASAPGPLLRAVLVEYADGPADLILTADRGFLDLRSLERTADVLLGRLAPGELEVVRSPETGTVGTQRPATRSGAGGRGHRVAWAVGDDRAEELTGVVSVALGAAAHEPSPSLVATAALVLGRYENQDAPDIGVLAAAPDAPWNALGALDTAWVTAVGLSGGRTVAELPTDVHAEPTGPYDEPGPLVGVLMDGTPAHGTLHLPCQTAPFPVTLVLRTTTDGALFLDVHHLLRYVDDRSARAFARHLAHVHRQLSDAPGRASIADIALLDEAEAQAQLALGRPERRTSRPQPGPATESESETESKPAPAPAPPPRRIDALFDEQAALRPTAPALTHDGVTLTYAELRDRAEHRAAGLRAAGVSPGERVGICLERSAELVVTMLAVLKAGAVYVPMDPAHPAGRLTYTARDAGLRVIVTDIGHLPGDPGVRTLTPAALAELAVPGNDPHAVPAGPADAAREAAYIIYTSGSTGRPKGVVVPHANVGALLDATRDDFALSADDTWTLFHSSAFDFSVWEIWGALLTGARLVVVDYWVSRSPAEFHELLVREHVTVLNQTPSAFAQLMEADRQHPPQLPVRLVVLGGEPLDTRTLPGWFDRYPENRCRLVNMFGITETTVHVTAQTVTRREAMAGSRSVGRPLAGWYVYVLDRRGRPIPAGTEGEIWVGGAGVAQEYLGRPELTAERFVPDPYAEGRLYRSGDLGRLRPDGTLEHLGRLDSQVKVRGFRIELDEIRNVLLDDPSVASAAVVLGGDALKDAAAVRIDAYVVPQEEQEQGQGHGRRRARGLDTDAVRRRAAELLPDYMVPATVTVLPALPLTANGKLDVRELPEPVPGTAADAAPDASGERPPVPRESARALAEVWEAVLGVPVGPDDNFFELGGNSLYAVRVAAALRERGLAPVSLRRLYTTPTVRALTGAAESASRADQ